MNGVGRVAYAYKHQPECTRQMEYTDSMPDHNLDVSLLREGILYITFQGDYTDAALPALKEDVARCAVVIKDESEKALRPLPAIVDVSKLNLSYSPNAIMLIADFEKKNRPYIVQTAVFGADTKTKFTGEIISSISNRHNIAFFDTKEAAMASLKQESPAV
jgi:hypothetical protein